MARITERLTARTIQAANKPGMYADGNGLYFRVGTSGSKSWILRYRANGQRHDLGLGGYPLFGLADARSRANAQRRLLADHIDPLAERKAKRAPSTATFYEVAEACIANKRAGWHDPKNEQTWRQSLTDYVYPVIGDLAVDAIDTAAVLRCIEPNWTKRTETMSRIRGRIEAILGYAKTKGYRTGDNPAQWSNHIENILPHRSQVQPPKKHAALPYTELAGFMAELRRLDRIEARALEFVILTAARLGEALGANWVEIDFEGSVWTVPAERMKARREHRVPLSAPALAILAALPRDGEQLVFAKEGRQLKNVAMQRLLERQLKRADLTTHGFRSTFRDWAAECTSIPSEVAEMALAHTVGSKVEAAYRRGDLFQKRRQLAEDWADYCNGITEKKVVQLRA